MVWHVKHSRALHEHLFVLRVEIQSVPRIKGSDAYHEDGAEFLAGNGALRLYGEANVPELLRDAREQGFPLGSTTSPIMSAAKPSFAGKMGKVCPDGENSLFAAMERHAVHVTAFFRLPMRRRRNRPGDCDLIFQPEQSRVALC